MLLSQNSTNIAPGRSRNNNFDFIRFCAATLVLFSHSYPLSGRNPQEPIAKFIGYETGGGIALAVFFIISGYLITASYINGKGPFDYIRKRSFRIFPGLIVAILLSILLGSAITPLDFGKYIIHPQTLAYLKNLVLNIQYNLPLVFSNNILPNTVNGSLWTLPVEVFMYGLVMLFGLAGALKRSVILTTTMILAIFYFFAGNYLSINNYIILNAAPLMQFFKLGTFFFLGSTFYVFKDKIPINGYVALLFFIAIVTTIKSSIGAILYTLLTPYLVFYISKLKIPTLANFGKHGDFSYGIYIYAFPVQQSVIYFLGEKISIGFFTLISFSITVVLAIISWKLVEAPALAYVRKNTFLTRSGHQTNQA